MLNSYLENIAVKGKGLTNDLESYCSYSATTVAAIPPSVWAGLLDLKYNANGFISDDEIPNLNDALIAASQSNNWGAVALAVASNPGTPANLQSRRQSESMIILGFDPFTSEPLSTTSVNIASLISYEQAAVKAAIQPYGYGDTQAIYEPYLLTQGYYVPQASDGTTAAAIAASVATQVGTTNGVILSATELLNINYVLPGSNVSVGGLVYVPTEVVGTTNSFLSIPPGKTIVLDSAPVGNLSTAPIAYAVGASPDGSDAGALVVMDADGSSIRYDANTWESYSTGIATNGDAIATITLMTPDQIPVGTLTVDTVTGAATVISLTGATL